MRLIKSPHYIRFVVHEGGSTFSIHKTEKLSVGDGVNIYFEDENLDKTVEHLVAKGMKFKEMPTDKIWL